jgi:transposase-like protein
MSIVNLGHAAPERGRRRMTMADLPPADTRRWVASRKAAVVAAVREGLLTPEEACLRYALTPEELDSWRIALDEHGVGALRTTRIQLYRAT